MLVVVSLIMVFVLQLTWTAGPRRTDGVVMKSQPV